MSYQAEGWAGIYDLEVKSSLLHSAVIVLSYFNMFHEAVSAQIISASDSVEDLQRSRVTSVPYQHPKVLNSTKKKKKKRRETH